MAKAHFGMIGLGTMGRNFLLNIAEHGISGVGYDLDAAKRQLLLDEGTGMPLAVGDSLEDFLAKLESPRNIMLLVPAGPIVDTVIGQLAPLLDEDDLIIDGGNSHFTDTERRIAELDAKNIGFMGIGVSGGEEGARHGASIMPGGRREHYDRIAATLAAVSAKVDGEPCVDYMGSGSAGHFVKMVHNGIEYGMMQLIAETYDGARTLLSGSDADMSQLFAEWNRGELNSFLIEITATVLAKRDDETGNSLVSMILDTAGQKGTGKWTSQAAMDLGVPVPTIDSAVTMRQISSRKSLRVELAKLLNSPPYTVGVSDNTGTSFVPERGVDAASADGVVLSSDELREALFAAFIITYAQGMSLLRAASDEKNYGLDLANIAKIWRGGCIIRSRLLEHIRAAFATNATLENLLLDANFAAIFSKHSDSLRKTVAIFQANGVPAMCFASALAYLDAFRTDRLPANLIQAQRDYFGAHTYQRTDKDGTFHTEDWSQNRER